MEVTVAKTAGFCFGVKRAVEKVYEQIGKTEKPIYTYGPIKRCSKTDVHGNAAELEWKIPPVEMPVKFDDI